MTKHINNLNQTSPKRELEQSLLKCIKTSLVVLEDTIWSSWPWIESEAKTFLTLEESR